MTEDPRGRGFPDLGRPDPSVTKAWNVMWHRLLVKGPTDLSKANALLHETRRKIGSRRR